MGCDSLAGRSWSQKKGEEGRHFSQWWEEKRIRICPILSFWPLLCSFSLSTERRVEILSLQAAKCKGIPCLTRYSDQLSLSGVEDDGYLTNLHIWQLDPIQALSYTAGVCLLLAASSTVGNQCSPGHVTFHVFSAGFLLSTSDGADQSLSATSASLG